jgi:hypothetical protein
MGGWDLDIVQLATRLKFDLRGVLGAASCRGRGYIAA